MLRRYTDKALLAATGQTTVYQAGDDGTYQTGVIRPAWTRFIIRGDGTVYDRATRLTWVQQPQLIIPGATGVHASNQIQAAKGNWATLTAYVLADLAKDATDSTYWVCAVAHTSAVAGTFANDRANNPTYWRQSVWTASAADLTTPSTNYWSETVTNVEALQYAGFSDWRLPNIEEALSLYNLADDTTPCIFGRALASPYFPNVVASGQYWSGTTRAAVTTTGWVVDFATNGYSYYRTKTTAAIYVRPCRGGRINV